MSSFTDYEKHHLHNYVHKKGTLYTKQEVDNKLSVLKSEIPDVVKASELSNLSETLFWESYQQADCLYKIDRGISTEVTFDNSTRAVSKLYDQSLKENDSTQTTQAARPILCTKAEKNNYRYFFKFDGSKQMLTNINLNPGTGKDDIINIFIVYKMNSFNGKSIWKNGLFGHYITGFSKTVAFAASGELFVTGTTYSFIVIGTNNFQNRQPIANYQTKANAGELNKWCCLSIHWNVPGGANKSSVWCNGKKLCNFTAITAAGANQMTLGNTDPNGKLGLDGAIAFFALYKERVISDYDIKLHHHVLCKNWYNIDHDPISFN